MRVGPSEDERGGGEGGGGSGSGFARVAAVLALAGFAIAAGLLIFGGGEEQHRYSLLFETGGQLVPGNEVKIGGAAVGSVDDLKLTDDGQARVDITLPRQLTEGTTAVIRATGLVGVANHYVSISPGPDNAEPIPEGGELTQVNTTTPVDIDQVFDTLDKPTREGLANVIRGQGGIYEDKGPEANESYKYLEPALSQTNLVLDELNEDSLMFERFIVDGSKLFTALADRDDDLAASLSSARTTFDAINSQSEAFSRDLQQLAPTFRQSNTTFLNLRLALDDVDKLVDVAKPATEDLAPFLADLRPVVDRSVPFFKDLSTTVRNPGNDNDLAELTALLPQVNDKAGPGFRRARRAIADFEPTLSFARPYSPEIINALTKLGQITSRYDANGHYVTVRPTGLNLFDYNAGTSRLDPLPASDQMAPFGAPEFPVRCPGAASQEPADGSAPFVGPAWPGSGLNSSDCDPAALPPGP